MLVVGKGQYHDILMYANLATPTRTWLCGRDAIGLYLQQQQQQQQRCPSAVRNHTHLNSRDDK